jgi:hypothetical protein
VIPNAVRLSSLLGRERFASQYVRFVRHWFEVVRIYAAANSTQVINLNTIGSLRREPVCLARLLVQGERAVAVD